MDLAAQAAALHAEALGLKAEQHHREHGRWPEWGWVEVIPRRYEDSQRRVICRVGDQLPPWARGAAVHFGELNDG